jgi:enamine deaminase RidA (YjgF/YER057c/UK114 family)
VGLGSWTLGVWELGVGCVTIYPVFMTIINPPDLPAPRGYNNGVVAQGRVLFVAGQIGWTQSGQLVPGGFVAQFARALENVLAVVREAGGNPDSVARLTIFVADKSAYVAAQREVGERYRALMGRHFPAMTLVEVKSLLEPEALVEIEATAVLGP